MGKTYENMMVDLMATNEKLRERAKRTVMTAAHVDYETATEALARAGGSVKVAIVMIRTGAGPDEARSRLETAGGFVRGAVTSEEERENR
jgi:N-acetylmuramic acid 6-phosphate etherase